MMFAVMMFSLLFLKTGVAQQTCSTALAVPLYSTITLDFDTDQAVVWIKHTPDSTAFRLNFFAAQDFSGFEQIDIYTGDCSTLILSDQMTEVDSSFVIEMTDLTKDYYIRIERSDITQPENMFAQNVPPFTPHTTQPIGCNLVSNPGFEILNPAATNWALNNNIGAIPFEINLLTGWQVAWGTPNITPSPNQPWNPNVNHVCFIWGTYHSTWNYYYGEAIFQDIDGLIPGNRYKLMLQLADGGHPQTPEFRAEFSNDFTPNLVLVGNTQGSTKPPTYVSHYNIVQGTSPAGLTSALQSYTSPSFVFDQSWTMNPNTNVARLTLYNDVVGQQDVAALLIDDVRIEPDEEIQVNITTINNCDALVEATLTGNYQNVQYTWATATNNGTGNTIQFPSQSLPITVTFTATYHDGCVAEEIVLVPEQINNFVIEPVHICLNDAVGSATTVLSPQTPPSAITPYAWVSWDDPNSFLNDPQILNPTFTTTSTGIYSFDLVLMDANGCKFYGTAEIIVTDADYPPPVITGTRSICDKAKTVYNYSIVNPQPDVAYTWSLNAGPWDAHFGDINDYDVDVEILNLPMLPDPTPGFVELIVTGNAGTDCEKSFTYRIYGCCEPDGIDTIMNDAVLTQAMLNNHSSVLLQGKTEIPANISFANIDVLMGPEASIVLAPGANLSIDLNTAVTGYQMQQGCYVMWEGIYVIDPNSAVEIENTTVMDAINAIVTKNGGGVSVDNSVFQDNFIGIDVMDYHSQIPGYTAQPFPGSVTGSTFRSGNPTNYHLGLFPMIGTPVFVGIRASEVDDFIIGDHNSGQNVFENMEYGIWARNSYLSLCNNKFENIKPDPGPANSLAANMSMGAVSSYFDLNSIVPINRILQAGTNQMDTCNRFIDCNVGIDAYNLKLVALNNRFDNTDRTAILLTQIGAGTHIENNTIIGAHTGIRAINLFPSSNAIDIAGNDIADVVTGIATINAGIHGLFSPLSGYYLRIYNNDILLKETADQIIKTGIFINNCPFANVSCNSIFRVNPPSSFLKRNVRGIWSSHTMHAAIYDNWTNQLGAGVYTTGIQTNTRYYCNNLNAGHHGFFFGDYTLLTNQGWINLNDSSGWNTHNIFNQQTESKLGMDEGNIINPVGIGSKLKWFYFDNQGQQFMPEIPGTPYIEDFFDDDVNNNAVHACGSSQQAPHCPPPSPSPYLVSGLTDDERDQLFADLLYMEEVYLMLNEEYHGYTAEYLYTVLFNDSSLMYLGGDLDNEYQAFYDSLRNVPISSFVEVEMLFNEGDYYAAREVNSSIEPRNNLEVYRQTVNEILFSTWLQGQYHFTPEDSATLLAIATLTPYAGGYGVYTARVMLGIDPQDHEVAYRKPAAQTGTQHEAVKLYPNPARALVTVEFLEETDLKHCFIEFYSVHGQKLLAEPLQNLSQTISVSALPNGIHFYRVVNNSRVVQTGKLVVRP
jgi:hypothetical protein